VPSPLRHLAAFVLPLAAATAGLAAVGIAVHLPTSPSGAVAVATGRVQSIGPVARVRVALPRRAKPRPAPVAVSSAVTFRVPQPEAPLPPRSSRLRAPTPSPRPAAQHVASDHVVFPQKAVVPEAALTPPVAPTPDPTPTPAPTPAPAPVPAPQPSPQPSEPVVAPPKEARGKKGLGQGEDLPDPGPHVQRDGAETGGTNGHDGPGKDTGQTHGKKADR
jgi:outer membrane biosynthesis protein TonB